jgi:hypothetical protein
MKNQQSFNKMIETQLAQLAVAVPAYESGKIPSQPENVSAITVRWRNPSHMPSTNHAGKPRHRRRNSWGDTDGS